MSNSVFFNRVVVEFEVEDAIVANGQKHAIAKIEKKFSKLAKELQKQYITNVYFRIDEITKE